MKIVKFYSQSCAPCKMLAPILAEIAETYGIEIESIDVEEDPRKAMSYAVRSVPTLVFENAGQRLTTIVGMTNRKVILAALGVQ